MKERPALAQSLDLARLVDGWEKGSDPISRGAPHIVVTYASKEVPSASVDCASALTHLELAASSMGLGACWYGFFYAAAASFPPLFQALRLPEGHQVFGAMMLGHPRHRFHRIPRRNEPSIEWR
jgi:nitroreductase